jgi:23S rRNA (guanosine2251-2'-O)-methyltransferase
MKKLKTNELKRSSLEEYKKRNKIPVVVILDNIRSSHNVGSVFRTCDAFLIQEICICGISPVPPDREIHKTALGATDSVKWIYYSSTIEAIKKFKKKDYIIAGVEQTDVSISLNKFEIERNKKYALVFGNEVNGIDDKIIDLLDLSIEIDQYGTKHSLNVSVVAGIILQRFCHSMLTDGLFK